MGRAAGNRASAVATATRIGARTRGATADRLDPELDALWFSHAPDLRQATALLQRLHHLTGRERGKLCEVMERIGPAVELDGPWRVIQHGPGHEHLAYCSNWVENMPAADNEATFTLLLDEFDGRLIDGLPEARYLGRCLCEMGEQLGAVAVGVPGA
jgi:hypothetical protein